MADHGRDSTQDECIDLTTDLLMSDSSADHPDVGEPAVDILSTGVHEAHKSMFCMHMPPVRRGLLPSAANPFLIPYSSISSGHDSDVMFSPQIPHSSPFGVSTSSPDLSEYYATALNRLDMYCIICYTIR